MRTGTPIILPEDPKILQITQKRRKIFDRSYKIACFSENTRTNRIFSASFTRAFEIAVYDAGGRYRIRIRYYENVPDPLVPYLEFANDESPTMATMYRYPLTAAGLGEPETRINWDPAWK